LVGKHTRCHIRTGQTSRWKAGAYSRDGTCTTINPRRICLIAGLRQGFDAPGNPSRTQRPTDQTRVHTGIVGRTSTDERWQAEDCGRRMTGTHPNALGTPTSSLQTDPLPGDASFQRGGAPSPTTIPPLHFRGAPRIAALRDQPRSHSPVQAIFARRPRASRTGSLP
jgi:hypothetical protein